MGVKLTLSTYDQIYKSGITCERCEQNTIFVFKIAFEPIRVNLNLGSLKLNFIFNRSIFNPNRCHVGDFLSRSKWTKVLIANAFFIPDFDVILQEILFHERFYIWFWNCHFFLWVRKFQSANLPRIKPSFSGLYQRFEVKLYMVYDLHYIDILEYIYFWNSFRAQGNYWRTNRLNCL